MQHIYRCDQCDATLVDDGGDIVVFTCKTCRGLFCRGCTTLLADGSSYRCDACEGLDGMTAIPYPT